MYKLAICKCEEISRHLVDRQIIRCSLTIYAHRRRRLKRSDMPATIIDAFEESLGVLIGNSDVRACGHVREADSAISRYERHGEGRLEKWFIPARQSTSSVCRL